MTPHLPGTPVWLAPDPESEDCYSVCPAVVAEWWDWIGEYLVATASGRHMVPAKGVFASEAEAVADRKRAAASDINHHRAKLAKAEAYLGRP